MESLLSATPTPVLAISAYFGDFFATYCQLTGVSLPEDGAERQSISLLPTLLGDTAEQQKDGYLYCELHGRHPRQAVRFGDYKAIRNPLGSDSVALYNLKTDIAEQRDISTKHPQQVEIAKQMMNQSHRESPLWPNARSSKEPYFASSWRLLLNFEPDREIGRAFFLPSLCFLV